MARFTPIVTGDEKLDRVQNAVARALNDPASTPLKVTAVRAGTGGTTYQATANDRYITVDATMGTVRVALPKSSDTQAITVLTVSKGKNAVTLARADGGSVSGVSVIALKAGDYDAVTVVCDGKNWWRA